MDDLERSRRFFLALPPDDRRYLRVDVTQREVVERRIQQAESGEVYRIVALVGDEMIADGALELSGETWARHIGEIRVIVARDYRCRRLGAMLIGELFHVAQQRGVEKVVVKMAAPQKAARKICERLGFDVDAVLPEHVKDSEGKLHDLVVMSCTLDAMWKELKDFYRQDDWPDG
jgi:L-amino acid N-acyltransferase YncA